MLQRNEQPLREAEWANEVIAMPFMSLSRRRSCRPSVLMALMLLDCCSDSADCLLMPYKTPTIIRRIQPPSYHLQLSHVSRGSSSHLASATAMHLFDKFSGFLHPYGISPGNNTGDDEYNQASVELLDALLPRLQTKEEKSRIWEGFQRARLHEQIRLSKLAKNGGGDGNGNDEENLFLADDANEVSRMTDLFQQNRLAEQLRLSKNKGGVAQTSAHDVDEIANDGAYQSEHEFDDVDKDEAFQRALLEERLKIRRLHHQKQRFVTTSDAIEKAMLEFENENEEEHKSLQMTMVQENDVQESDDETTDSELGLDDVLDATIITSSSPANNGDGNNKDVLVGEVSVNQTQENVPSKQLGDKLEKLHNMVAMATTSSSTRSLPSGVMSNSTKLPLQSFLSTTYLPLSPREDASALSLVLAPLAHLLSSLFLLGVAGFYAIIAVLDVIWNDNEAEHSTRACLRETSSVWRSSWQYAFPKAGEEVYKSAAQRTMKAMQASIVALFYATQCVFMRAAKHSRYSNDCMDAGTGSLRYLVYAMRSVNVIWARLVDAVKSSNRESRGVGQNKNVSVDEKHNKLNLLRVLSGIKASVSRRLRDRDEQQRSRSNELYNKKLRLLNLDRVTLERDRQRLQETKQQLDFDRRKLLVESVNVLAWYSAIREVEESVMEGESETRDVKKKRHWSLWRRREDE